MEKNVSKTLSFRTETIASLSDFEQNRFMGGWSMDCTKGGWGCPSETEQGCPVPPDFRSIFTCDLGSMTTCDSMPNGTIGPCPAC